MTPQPTTLASHLTDTSNLRDTRHVREWPSWAGREAERPGHTATRAPWPLTLQSMAGPSWLCDNPRGWGGGRGGDHPEEVHKLSLPRSVKSVPYTKLVAPWGRLKAELVTGPPTPFPGNQRMSPWFYLEPLPPPDSTHPQGVGPRPGQGLSAMSTLY